MMRRWAMGMYSPDADSGSGGGADANAGAGGGADANAGAGGGADANAGAGGGDADREGDGSEGAQTRAQQAFQTKMNAYLRQFPPAQRAVERDRVLGVYQTLTALPIDQLMLVAVEGGRALAHHGSDDRRQDRRRDRRLKGDRELEDTGNIDTPDIEDQDDLDDMETGNRDRRAPKGRRGKSGEEDVRDDLRKELAQMKQLLSELTGGLRAERVNASFGAVVKDAIRAHGGYDDSDVADLHSRFAAEYRARGGDMEEEPEIVRKALNRWLAADEQSAARRVENRRKYLEDKKRAREEALSIGGDGVGGGGEEFQQAIRKAAMDFKRGRVPRLG